MVERDAVAPRDNADSARSSTINFMAFDFNNDRQSVPVDIGSARWVIGYLPAQGGGVGFGEVTAGVTTSTGRGTGGQQRRHR